YHKRIQLIVAPITYTTASYLLSKQNNSKDVRAILANFRQLVRVAATNERVIDDALASRFDDFEDAVQYYTAIKAKADIIITRNEKDFAASKIPIMNAAEYLATIG
ncbi:MAG: PIN domain-containing protein, partial [Paludibacteraceae bacterium]|nr:PIN domain-containing protein [Paludibacteraceae bacterium]